MIFSEMIKVGDLVIKNTGGNKMRVVTINNNKAECAWVTESFNQGIFDVNELVPISESKHIYRMFHRAEIIDNLLK